MARTVGASGQQGRWTARHPEHAYGRIVLLRPLWIFGLKFIDAGRWRSRKRLPPAEWLPSPWIRPTEDGTPERGPRIRLRENTVGSQCNGRRLITCDMRYYSSLGFLDGPFAIQMTNWMTIPKFPTSRLKCRKPVEGIIRNLSMDIYPVQNR